VKRLVAVLMLLVLASCFKPKGYDDALFSFQQKDWDTAAARFARLVIDYPDNVEFKVKWEMAKSNASKAHAREGRVAVMKGDLDLAAKEYNRAIFFDGTNQYVQDQLRDVMRRIRERDMARKHEGTTLEQMGAENRASVGVPMLTPTSDQPIDLHFAERRSLKDIYMSLGMMSGVNVIFDSSFQDSR